MLRPKVNQLRSYCNNTKDGSHFAVLFNVNIGVRYPKGLRDLCFFMITNKNCIPLKDKKDNPYMAVVVANHTKRKSSKSKIVRLARYLLREEHNISFIESYRSVPPIEDFIWSSENKYSPYEIIVKNKTVGKNTVSNVVMVKSFLSDWVNLEQEFHKPK